jgi:hypothetical protein
LDLGVFILEGIVVDEVIGCKEVCELLDLDSGEGTTDDDDDDDDDDGNDVCG